MIADTQAPPSERAFAFPRTNCRDPKPRARP